MFRLLGGFVFGVFLVLWFGGVFSVWVLVEVVWGF